MHVPRNPPDTERILSDARYAGTILSEAVSRYARDFNERYLHWSEVRRRDTGDIDPDIVWARMKLAREDNCARVSLDDTVFSYPEKRLVIVDHDSFFAQEFSPEAGMSRFSCS